MTTTAMISFNDLSELFANYAVRLAWLNRACTAADEVAAQEQGRSVTTRDRREREIANEAEREALMAVIRAPVSGGLIRWKAQWLLNHLSMGNSLDTEHYEALLESLARARACEGEAS